MFSLARGNLIRIGNNGLEDEVIHPVNNKFVIGSTPLSDYHIGNAKTVCCEIFADDLGRVCIKSSTTILLNDKPLGDKTIRPLYDNNTIEICGVRFKWVFQKENIDSNSAADYASWSDPTKTKKQMNKQRPKGRLTERHPIQNLARANLTSKTPETVVSTSQIPREGTSEDLEMDTPPHTRICTTPMVGQHRNETSTADNAIVLERTLSDSVIYLDDSIVESSQNVSTPTIATPAASLIAQNSNCSAITVSSDGSDARNNHNKDLESAEDLLNDIFDDEFDANNDTISLNADDDIEMDESEPDENELEHINDPIPSVDPVNEMPTQTETPTCQSNSNGPVLCDNTVSSSQDIDNAMEHSDEVAGMPESPSQLIESSEQSPKSASDQMQSNNEQATDELATPQIKVENVAPGDTNTNRLLGQPTTSTHLVPLTPITENTPLHSSDHLHNIKMELNKNGSSDQVASDGVEYVAPDETNAQIVKVEEVVDQQQSEAIQLPEQSEQMQLKEEKFDVEGIHDGEMVASEVAQKIKAEAEYDEFEIEQAEPEAATSTAVKSEAIESNPIELKQENEPMALKQESTDDGMDISSIVDAVDIATEANMIEPKVAVVSHININTTINDIGSCNVVESEAIEATTNETDMVESQPIIPDATVSHDVSSIVANVSLLSPAVNDTIAIDQIVDETEPFDSVHQHAGPIDCYEASGENSVQDLPVNDTLADLNLTHETKLTTPELVQSELQSPSKENIVVDHDESLALESSITNAADNIVHEESCDNNDTLPDIGSDPCGEILENPVELEPMELETEAVEIQPNEIQQLNIVPYIKKDFPIVGQDTNQSSDCHTVENKEIAAPEYEIEKDVNRHENETDPAEINEDDKFEDAISEPFEQSMALINFSIATEKCEVTNTSQEHRSVDVSNKSMALQNTSSDELDESSSNTAEWIAEQSRIQDPNNTTQLDDYDFLFDSSEAIDIANDCLENAQANEKQSDIVLKEEVDAAHPIDDICERLPYQHNQSIELVESAKAEIANISFVADKNEAEPIEFATSAATVLDEHSNDKSIVEHAKEILSESLSAFSSEINSENKIEQAVIENQPEATEEILSETISENFGEQSAIEITPESSAEFSPEIISEDKIEEAVIEIQPESTEEILSETISGSLGEQSAIEIAPESSAALSPEINSEDKIEEAVIENQPESTEDILSETISENLGEQSAIEISPESSAEFSPELNSENKIEQTDLTNMGDSPKIVGPYTDIGTVDDDTSIGVYGTTDVGNESQETYLFIESGVDMQDLDQSGQTAKTDIKSSSDNESDDTGMQESATSSFTAGSVSKSMSCESQESTPTSLNDSYMSKLELSQSDSSLDLHGNDEYVDRIDDIAESSIEEQSITKSVEKITMELEESNREPLAIDSATSTGSIENGTFVEISKKVDMPSEIEIFEHDETVTVSRAMNDVQPVPTLNSVALTSSGKTESPEKVNKTEVEVVDHMCSEIIENVLETPKKITADSLAKSIEGLDKLIERVEKKEEEATKIRSVVQNKFLEATKTQEIESSPRRSPRQSRAKKDNTPKKVDLLFYDTPTTPRPTRAAKNAACVSISALCVKETPTKAAKKESPMKRDPLDLDTPRQSRYATRKTTPAVSTLAKEPKTPAKARESREEKASTSTAQSAANESPKKSPASRNISPAKVVSVVNKTPPTTPTNTNVSPFKVPQALDKTPIRNASISPQKIGKQLLSPAVNKAQQKILNPTLSPAKPTTPLRSPAKKAPSPNQSLLKPGVGMNLSPTKSQQEMNSIIQKPLKPYQGTPKQSQFIRSPVKTYSASPATYKTPTKQPNKMFPVKGQSPYVHFPVVQSPNMFSPNNQSFGVVNQTPARLYSAQTQSPIRMSPLQSQNKNQYMGNNSPYIVQSTSSQHISPNRPMMMNATPINNYGQGVKFITPQQQTYQLGPDVTVVRISPPSIAGATQISPIKRSMYTPVQNTMQFHAPQNAAQFTPTQNTTAFLVQRQSARLRNTPQQATNQMLYTPNEVIPATPKNTMMTPRQQNLMKANASMNRSQLIDLQITPMPNGAAYNQSPTAQRSGRNLPTSAQSTIATPNRGRGGLRNHAYVEPTVDANGYNSTQQPMQNGSSLVKTPTKVTPAKYPTAQPTPSNGSISVEAKSKRNLKRKVVDEVKASANGDADAETIVGRSKRNRRNDEAAAAKSVAEDKPKRGGRRGKQVSSDESEDTVEPTSSNDQEEPGTSSEEQPSRPKRTQRKNVNYNETDDKSMVKRRLEPEPPVAVNMIEIIDDVQLSAPYVSDDAKPTRGGVRSRNQKHATNRNNECEEEIGAIELAMNGNGTDVPNAETVDADAELNGHDDKPKRGGRKKVTFDANVVTESAKRVGRPKRLMSKSESETDSTKGDEKPKRGGRSKRVNSGKSDTDGEAVVDSGNEKSTDETEKPKRKGRTVRNISELDSDVYELESDASSKSDVPLAKLNRRAKHTTADSSDDVEERPSRAGRKKASATKLNDIVEETSGTEMSTKRGPTKRKKAQANDENETPTKQSKLDTVTVDSETGTKPKRGKQSKVSDKPVEKIKRATRGTKRSAKTSDHDEQQSSSPKQKKIDSDDEAAPTPISTRTRRRVK